LSCGGFPVGLAVDELAEDAGLSLVEVSFESVDFFVVFSPSPLFFVASSGFAFSSSSTDSLDFFFADVPLLLAEVADFFVPLVVDDFADASADFVVVAFFSATVSAVVLLAGFVFVVFFEVSSAVFSPASAAFVLFVEDFDEVEDSVVFFRTCAVAGHAINTTQMNEKKSFTGQVPPEAHD
jgi:hypothetical protein